MKLADRVTLRKPAIVWPVQSETGRESIQVAKEPQMQQTCRVIHKPRALHAIICTYSAVVIRLFISWSNSCRELGGKPSLRGIIPSGKTVLLL